MQDSQVFKRGTVHDGFSVSRSSATEIGGDNVSSNISVNL